MAFSGNGNLWVEKVRSMAKYDSTFAESIAPVVGFSEDIIEVIKKPVELMTNDEAETFLEGLGEVTKEVSEVTPIVREFAPLLEPEEPETLSQIKSKYATGGLVKGKDDVPFTKEDPADRKDPRTGKPYSDQMARLGLAEGGSTSQSRMLEINDYLRGKGYNKKARAGILANIAVETGNTYNPFEQEKGNSKKGYGLFQLTGKRKDYNNWMKENNFNEQTVDNIPMQLEYMHETIYGNELMGTKKGREIGGGTASKLQQSFATGTPEEIALSFSNEWEKPGIPHNDRRVKKATELFNIID